MVSSKKSFLASSAWKEKYPSIHVNLDIISSKSISCHSLFLSPVAVVSEILLYYLLKGVKEMDQREHQVQSFSICNRLHNFIMNSLSMSAFKSVTLGRPLPVPHQDSSATAYGYDCDHQKGRHAGPQEAETTSLIQGTEQRDDVMKPSSKEVKVDGSREVPIVQDESHVSISEEGAPSPAVGNHAKPPKKVVSINDNVEEIEGTGKGRKNWKRSSKKLALGEEEEAEPQPLKSILKVGSKLGGIPNSFVNLT